MEARLQTYSNIFDQTNSDIYIPRSMEFAKYGGGLGGLKKTTAFGSHLIASRWFMFFASMLIMSVSGASYLFGLYSNEIKTSLGYDQTTLNLLSFFKDLGSNVGVLSGLINEVTPPWVGLCVGATMNFFGYFMIWLAVTNHTAKPRVWQMCLYMCIGANSQTFSNTCVLATCVKNFPQSRGNVIGLLKGYVGLSGAIITQLYHTFYGVDSEALILLIAWLPPAVSFVFLIAIRYISVIPQQQQLKVFYRLLHISLSLAGLLMILIIIQTKFPFSRVEYIGGGIVVLLFLLLPLLIVVREELHSGKTKTQALRNDTLDLKIGRESSVSVELPQPEPQSLSASSPSPSPSQPLDTASCVSHMFKAPERGEDYTILQALFSVDMLILFLAVLCGVGGTLTAVDNLGQIGNSLGYGTQSITTFVSLVSIWNYLGRAAAGFASEFLLTKYRFPRTLMLTFVMLISCIGHLFIAFGVPYSLYFASVIIGFCFGAQWCLMFAIISEIFGLKYYSTLFNLGSVASPVGSYIFSVKVAGNLYDKEAVKQLEAKGLKRQAGKDLSCAGVQCFRTVFIITAASTLLGSLISFILVLRTRKFYSSDVLKKFREEDAKEAYQSEMATASNLHDPQIQ